MLKKGEKKNRAAIGVKNKLRYLAENRSKKTVIETQRTARANKLVCKEGWCKRKKQLVPGTLCSGTETGRTC